MKTETVINNSQLEKAWKLFSLLRRRDIQTCEHSLNVACIAKVCNNFIKTDLGKNNLFIAGLLHDVGKITLPDFVFENYIVDSESDLKTIREHTRFTKWIMENNGFDKDIIAAAYQHHERYNGEGYPLGLSGKSIILEGRLLAIIDSYSAITEDRPYRKGETQKKAIDILTSEKERYDLNLLTIFTKNLNNIVCMANVEEERYKQEIFNRNVI